MTPKVTDEELNGAANALLGLHARDGSRPAPSSAPIAPPPPRRNELDLAKRNPEQRGSRQTTCWSPSNENTVSPSFSTEPPPLAPVPAPAPAPAAPISEQQSPAANPYPFYPKPTVAAMPYMKQQQQQHGGYYDNPSHVVSTRRDFVRAGGRGAWTLQQQQQAGPTTTTTPRRRTEWTPRFGPPMTADPRTVMAVRHLPAVDAWTYLQHQQQPGAVRAHRSPSPSHHAGPDTRRMYDGSRGYQPKVSATVVEACHPAGRDRYRDYAHAATRHRPKYEYPQQQQQQQQKQPCRYEHREQQPPPEQQQQQQQQQQQNERHRHEQQLATTAAARRRELQQEQPQPQQQQQQQPRPPPQKDVQKQPSINNLWSLIPGTLERQGSARPGDHHNNVAAGGGGGGGGGATPRSQQQISRGISGSSDRWFAPDVHLPLTDIARRHRARALARLRARRRALAEASLIPGRPAPVKRHSSDTTNEADSGSDGENEDDDRGHRSKVFLVEGEPGVPRVVSGGLTRGVSGGVVRAVSGGSTVGDDAGSGDEQATAPADVVLDGDATHGRRGTEGGVVPAAGGGGGGRENAETTAAARATSTASSAPAACSGPASSSCSSSAQNPHATSAPSGNKGSNGGSATTPKVGDLFELMRSVTMSFGTGGGGGDAVVEGEENLARELGKPVKYRYRQEAARSRKRTRGRFVSEKAPAFVSITELMALRRAERERQQKEEASPVPVSAG